jgi:hypothetical protein
MMWLKTQIDETAKAMLQKFLSELYRKIDGYFDADEELRMLGAHMAGEQALQNEDFIVIQDEDSSLKTIVVHGVPEDLRKGWCY